MIHVNRVSNSYLWLPHMKNTYTVFSFNEIQKFLWVGCENGSTSTIPQLYQVLEILYEQEEKTQYLGLGDRRRKSVVSVSHSVNHHHCAIKKFNETQGISLYYTHTCKNIGNPIVRALDCCVPEECNQSCNHMLRFVYAVKKSAVTIHQQAT